jgi:recombinational DNA repair ATPase RecF
MDPREEALKAAKEYPGMMMVLPQPDALEFFQSHLNALADRISDDDVEYVQELQERVYDWHKLLVAMKLAARGESSSRHNFWQEEEA